ncbi:unnamed protein product [Brassica napus]|uniref:(rape) hypothetical protein n=1 Tax=Brassica napus TaxID=3708 RepID=A0A816JD20_BRANA|nr:unnamed protein product [Brassica napus]
MTLTIALIKLLHILIILIKCILQSVFLKTGPTDS